MSSNSTASVFLAGILPGELLEQFRAIVRHELQQLQPASPPPTEDLLTIEQAAALLNVTVHTIHDWKKSGKLPFFKMGARTYFKRRELMDSLQRQQRTAKKGGRTRG